MQLRRHMPMPGRRRPGFTLLEVVLAVAISTTLLAGLYVALSIQFQHGRACRDHITQSSIVRAVLTKVTNDVSPIQGPTNPFLTVSNAYGNQSTSSSSNSANGNSGNSSSNNNSSAPTVSPLTVNVGVNGNNSAVIFTISRALSRKEMMGENTDDKMVSDIRRIAYFVDSKGLWRREDTEVTDPSLPQVGNLTLPPPHDGNCKLISEHVSSMALRYYGSLGVGQADWNETWDGSGTQQVENSTTSNSSSDTVPPSVPQGPPAAIEFTFTFKIPLSAGKDREVSVRHVVAIPCANRAGVLTTATP